MLYSDGLRGVAALMVVVFHWWGGAGNPTLPVRIGPTVTVDLLSPIGALGGSRVSLFFVLSGFLLHLPFAQRAPHGNVLATEPAPPRRAGTLAGWLGRRFRRLAPPYYAAVALALFPIAGSFYGNEAWRVWGQHLPPRTPQFHDLLSAFPWCLFFLHGLIPGCEKPAFNGSLWTLTPEVQLYFLFPC